MPLLHLILFIAVVLIAVVCVAVRLGRMPRPWPKVLLPIAPIIALAVLCQFLLAAGGVPLLEWLLPMIAVLVVGFFCRSESLFRTARRSLFLLAVALCVNFLVLVQVGGYTAAPGLTDRVSRMTALNEAASRLRESYKPGDVLPAGPLEPVEHLEPRPEWHTPLTRIHRLERTKAVIWYPGGAVEDGAGRLEIR